MSDKDGKKVDHISSRDFIKVKQEVVQVELRCENGFKIQSHYIDILNTIQEWGATH